MSSEAGRDEVTSSAASGRPARNLNWFKSGAALAERINRLFATPTFSRPTPRYRYIMSKRKRSQDDYDALSHNSVGQTLSRLNGASPPADAQAVDGISEAPKEPENGDDWEVAGSKKSKKRKKAPAKEKGNYPEIGHSVNARLQSYVKLYDLQGLVLYTLADGTAPQWCSIKHHSSIRKVVTVMVPGLEHGLFNGAISLEPAKEAVEDVKEEKSEEQPTAEQQDSNAVLLGAQLFSGASAADDGVQVKAHPKPEPVTLVPKPEPVAHRKMKVTPDDYYPTKLVEDQVPEPLLPIAQTFEHLWPIKTPGDDRNSRLHSPMAAMLTATIPKTKEEKNRKGPQFPAEGKNWKNKRAPVTEMLATTAELMDEGYVMHPAHFAEDRDLGRAETESRRINKKTTEDGWVDTKNINKLSDGDAPEDQIEKGSTTQGRKVLAMDCEMCITSPEGVTPQEFSLTRISIIDWDGQVVMDEFVKPKNPITNYLTQYSGITSAMLEGVNTSLEDVQQKLLEILTPQSILIGHSLNSDLNALHVTHPFIIDTALLFPHPRGPPLKSSLKWLCSKYLSREIQKGSGSTGHNSVEDARACLDLVKQKCERGKLWGTSEAAGESIFKRLGRAIRPKRDKVNPIGDDEYRTGAVVDWGEPMRGFGSQAKIAIGCETDADVVAGIKRAITGDGTESMPVDGVDFVWARMRELEARQGWWNRSKGVDSDALRSSTTASSEDKPLADVVAQTSKYIREIYESLPPCTAFVVYSGSGDPRELSEMQAMQTKFKQEYKVKKWDELSVKWTDDEEQRLRKACDKARKGVGFVAVK